MAINLNHLARTSGFDNNCGLHCLIHAYCDHILTDSQFLEFVSGKVQNVPSTHTTQRDVLALHKRRTKILHGFTKLTQHFKQYYQLGDNFTHVHLAKILQNTPDKLARERLLGPVFRAWSQTTPGTALEDFDLLGMANDLNIRLQSYNSNGNYRGDLTFDNIAHGLKHYPRLQHLGGKQVIDENAPKYTLQLYWHNGHWEYIERNAKIRNKHNQDITSQNGAVFDPLGLKLGIHNALSNIPKNAPDDFYNLTPVMNRFKVQTQQELNALMARYQNGGAGGDGFSAMGNKISEAMAPIKQMFSGLFGNNNSNGNNAGNPLGNNAGNHLGNNVGNHLGNNMGNNNGKNKSMFGDLFEIIPKFIIGVMALQGIIQAMAPMFKDMFKSFGGMFGEQAKSGNGSGDEPDAAPVRSPKKKRKNKPNPNLNEKLENAQREFKATQELPENIPDADPLPVDHPLYNSHARRLSELSSDSSDLSDSSELSSDSDDDSTPVVPPYKWIRKPSGDILDDLT